MNRKEGKKLSHIVALNKPEHGYGIHVCILFVWFQFWVDFERFFWVGRKLREKTRKETVEPFAFPLFLAGECGQLGAGKLRSLDDLFFFVGEYVELSERFLIQNCRNCKNVHFLVVVLKGLFRGEKSDGLGMTGQKKAMDQKSFFQKEP